jgi:anti-repressor protein
MTNLVVLKEQEILGKTFTIYGDVDNPLFLAKDIANYIEHNKPGEMISPIDDNEKLKAILSLSGQNREVWLLTEDGVYEVLMQSRKPIAKEFKKQVKSILRQIRQTGGYVKQTRAIDFVEQWLPQLDDASKGAIASQLEENIKLKKENKELKPKADNYDKFLSGDNYQSMNEVAKVVGIGRNKLFDFLRRNRILMENNVPYQRYIESGYFIVKESVIDKGYAFINTATTYVTAKGIEWIEKMLATRASNITKLA